MELTNPGETRVNADPARVGAKTLVEDKAERLEQKQKRRIRHEVRTSGVSFQQPWRQPSSGVQVRRSPRRPDFRASSSLLGSRLVSLSPPLRCTHLD